MKGLNDPFDLLPFDMTDPEFRDFAQRSRDEIGKERGLMCFSRSWTNPVLWSHYADNHRGLCLGLDVPDHLAKSVEYIASPYANFEINLECAEKMLFTKYSHWQYESEVRVWSSLVEKSGSLYFHGFSENMQLAQVIVGAANMVSRCKLQGAFRPTSAAVPIIKARTAYNTFEIVEDETFSAEA